MDREARRTEDAVDFATNRLLKQDVSDAEITNIFDFDLSSYDLDRAIKDIRHRGMAEALENNVLVQEAMQPRHYPHLISRMVHHHINKTPLLYQQASLHNEAQKIDEFFTLVRFPNDVYPEAMHDLNNHHHQMLVRIGPRTQSLFHPLSVQEYDRTGRVFSIAESRTHEYTDDLVKQFMSEWRAYGRDMWNQKIHNKKIGRYVNFASDRLAKQPVTDQQLRDLQLYGHFL